MGDRQSQPGPLRISGRISAHKPCRDLVRIKVQLRRGHIFHGDRHTILLLDKIDIDARMRHTVFRDVHNQVFKDTLGFLAVQ